MLTIERAREALDYDPTTGFFYWKIKAARRINIGDLAGCVDANGYVKITLDGQVVLAHRLAWFHVYGVWPSKDLDHRDKDRKHNAIRNLREADRSQNKANGSVQKNKSGLRGVRQNGLKYVAVIKWHHERYNLGTFNTATEAYAAYKAKAKELHGEFAA